MKISEYNQMMSYLTRPGVKKSNSSTANINNNKSSKSASGDRKDLSKYTGVFRKPLQEASIESLVPDKSGEKLLRYIDGVKNNDPKTLKAIDDYSDQLHLPLVRSRFISQQKGEQSDYRLNLNLFSYQIRIALDTDIKQTLKLKEDKDFYPQAIELSEQISGLLKKLRRYTPSDHKLRAFFENINFLLNVNNNIFNFKDIKFVKNNSKFFSESIKIIKNKQNFLIKGDIRN